MSGDEKKLIRNSTVEFLIFTSAAGEDSIEVRYEDETIWLSQTDDGGALRCDGSDNKRTPEKHLRKRRVDP